MPINSKIFLNFAFPNSIKRQFLVCDRGTDATYFDEKGRYTTAGIDAARFGLIALNKPPGMICEKEATNLLLHSNDLTQTIWDKTNASITTTAVTGISNWTPNAITASAANGTVGQSVTASLGTYTFSCYMWMYDSTHIPGNVHISLDAGVTWTQVFPLFQLFPDMSSRIQITQGGLTNPDVRIRVANSGGKLAVQFCQLEAGDFATTYIPTGISTATRDADNIHFIIDQSLAYPDDWFNPDEGTIVIHAEAYKLGMADQTLLHLRDAAGAGDYVQIKADRSGPVNLNCGYSQTYDYGFFVNCDNPGQQISVATSYDQNGTTGLQFVAMGGRRPLTPGTDQDQTYNFSAIDQLCFGSDALSSDRFSGIIYQFKFFEQAFSIDVLKELSKNLYQPK